MILICCLDKITDLMHKMMAAFATLPRMKLPTKRPRKCFKTIKNTEKRSSSGEQSLLGRAEHLDPQQQAQVILEQPYLRRRQELGQAQQLPV